GGYPKFDLPRRKLREIQPHVSHTKAQPRPNLPPKGLTGSVLCLRVLVGKVGVEQYFQLEKFGAENVDFRSPRMASGHFLRVPLMVGVTKVGTYGRFQFRLASLAWLQVTHVSMSKIHS